MVYPSNTAIKKNSENKSFVVCHKAVDIYKYLV